MVRSSVRIQEDPSSDDEDLYAAPSRTSRVSRTNATISSSSDKENTTSAKTAKEKGKGKERRNDGDEGLAELDATQALYNKVLEEEADKDAYDPDQDPEERRQVKKQYRDLARKLQGEYSPSLPLSRLSACQRECASGYVSVVIGCLRLTRF